MLLHWLTTYVATLLVLARFKLNSPFDESGLNVVGLLPPTPDILD
ncbi:hypothetical protein BFJ63_vAg803 [Fusarium oxysporum f. sp. narcissi]|uniref:Uncharacterized protein n=3 Tax=Fusarium oxysporum TaxID=5507 RepID=A0A420RP87_FUSOX|nr:hypothetical protein BFJ65_g9630 [Fusarium oxysporum f. sp. cepae]RKK87153.1 hypothetical protein BFJ69_g673 [Fusarium oxysporum]RYC96440.1 hypothetical protein BFJ63_vAg803 [Fusarium oxysporum f. sp. narcissi]RKK60162.1 hypothetical protein BFJ66_g1960 [Fusarium oxysporum f. sp. cepae]RKK63902.1 hypothetical protein BFJ67_g544 [Fusarium oxysporum f. sp. cepae]